MPERNLPASARNTSSEVDIQSAGLLTRLVRTRPLFLASILFLCGCALEYGLGFEPAALWCALGALLLLALILQKIGRRWVAPLLILALLPAGALRFEAQWRALSPLPDEVGAHLCGRIIETPVWNAETERTICVLDEVAIDDSPVKGRLRLYLRGDIQLLQSVELAQYVRCTAHVWRADEATNFGEFDFSNYLRLNGLRGYATAKIEDAALEAAPFRLSDVPQRVRASLGARIDRLFPENAPLARAFLLGDRSGLSAEEREGYAKSGAAHLLAISGMHVSVLAMAFSLLLGCFLKRNHAFFITLGLMTLYGLLIGASSSLVRAILMFAIFGFAPIAGRYSDGPTRLAAAMLVYLLVRPIAVLESSFILSYGACAGIILLSAPLTRLFRAEAYLQKPPSVGFKALFTQRLPRWIVKTLIVTTAAQLAILPAVAHFFGAQPLLSFAVNLVAVPLAMAAYLLSLLAWIVGIAPIAAAGDFLFGLLTRCVSFFGTLPLSTLRVARFPLWLSIVCALICLLSSDLSRFHEKLRRYLPLSIIAAILISNLLAQMTLRGCSVVFLDAGQADCAVLRTEGRVYLIDTGDPYTPAADYLSAMNYAPDAIFLTHPHQDHAGGLKSVLEVCTPKRIYLSANWGAYEAGDVVTEALATAQSRGVELVSVSAGDEIALSDKTILEVRSPVAGIARNSANDDSLILCLKYGDASALFCGDAPAEVVEGNSGDVDLLKVGHHGGADALSPSLLAESTPSAAILSSGYNNYGHPARSTLDLLRTAGARAYRTDRCGAITCRMQTDGSLILQTYRALEDEDGLE